MFAAMTIGQLEATIRVQEQRIRDLALALRMLATHASDPNTLPGWKLPPMHAADEQFIREMLACANAFEGQPVGKLATVNEMPVVLTKDGWRRC